MFVESGDKGEVTGAVRASAVEEGEGVGAPGDDNGSPCDEERVPVKGGDNCDEGGVTSSVEEEDTCDEEAGTLLDVDEDIAVRARVVAGIIVEGFRRRNECVGFDVMRRGEMYLLR